MTTVISYSLKENKEGKQFVNLELAGDLTMVQSTETGRYYATKKKCFISSTFDEETAKSVIGTQIPGTIQKVDVEEYEYEIPVTGEVITLSHSWEFIPEGQAKPLRVVSPQLAD